MSEAQSSAVNSEKPAARRQMPIGRPFVKGQSGNPTGRPKTAPISEACRALALAGNPSGAAQLAQALLKAAKKGDVSAAREFADRVEGKARQSVEISNPDGSLASIVGLESAVKLLALRGFTVARIAGELNAQEYETEVVETAK